MVNAAMMPPERLNGYLVKRFITHANCVTVEVRIRAHTVVATWWPDLGETWSWGHYYRDADRASAGFVETAERNENR